MSTRVIFVVSIKLEKLNRFYFSGTSLMGLHFGTRLNA
jgi:hypothetical protein